MLDYYALEALAVVVREKNFTKAAKALFLTQSAVSQRIRSLENIIGRPLMVRSPSIKATQTGEQLISHFHNITILEHSLKKKCLFKHDRGKNLTLAVAVNTESLSTWFISAIGKKLKDSEIILEILIEDQERTIDFLRAGKVWGCVTSISKAPYGCVSRPLGKMTYRLVSTPEFFKKYFSRGVNGASLLEAPAAIYGENDYMHRNFLSSNFPVYKQGKPTVHLVPSPQALVDFALNGLAFVLLPEMSVEKKLNRGDLVDLLPTEPFLLPLYFQTQELQTDVTSEFAEGIVNSAQFLLK